MSQFLTEYFVSGFTLILPTLIRELDIPQLSSMWPATAFSLVIASTLLVSGRLGHMWGGYPIFLWGLAWLLIWSIIVGFSIDPLMLDFCRALQGLGAAAFLPTGVMLMGSLYRPGPRKNLVFAIYGTSAVFGFFGGIFVAGIVGQFLRTPNAPLISPHGSTSHSSRNLVATHSCLAPSVVYAPAMKAGHVVAVNRALLGRMNER